MGGPTSQMLAASPHLEALKKRGYEVLYLTDGVDQWAVEGLQEFDGKKLINAMEDDFKLDEADKDSEAEKSEASDEQTKEFASFIERCKEVLDAHVGEVKVSQRLTDSPVCLVMPKGGMPAHLERLLRAHQNDLPSQKRILEINPQHPLLQRLREKLEAEPQSEQVKEWIELLFDQALVSEGSPLPDPARFAQRMTTLMQSALYAQEWLQPRLP